MRRSAALFRRLAALGRDSRGATVVEFAMVAPVMCMVLLGAFDVSHTLYTRSVLQGIVQKTARDATLESVGSNKATLDERVRSQVRALANNATINITRRWYHNFTQASAGTFEPYTDTNRNRTCDAGEPYDDTNNNSRWDRESPDEAGGARDAVLYTVSVSYPRNFPVNRLIGGSSTTTVTASTVLRNQPYGDQPDPAVRNCT